MRRRKQTGRGREWYESELNEEIQMSRAGHARRTGSLALRCGNMTEVDRQVAAEDTSLQLDEPRKRPNRSDKRRTLLNEEPLLLGSSWARVWCKSMQTD